MNETAVDGDRPEPSVSASSHTARRASAYLAAHPAAGLAALLAAGALLRLALVGAPSSGDYARYMGLADALLRGEGYRINGELNTYLAPGYPVFLAAVRSVWDSLAFVTFVQAALSLVSGAFVYAAIAPKSRGLASLAWAIMALDPWLAASSVTILSENLTVFLLSVAVYLVSRLELGEAKVVTACLLGATMAAAGLTAPHALPLAAAVLAWGAWRLRRRAHALFALVAGLVAVMAPWQLHCVYAQGHMNPLVFNAGGYAFQNSGYVRWIKTWAITSADGRLALFNLDKFAELPDRAFRSPEERAELAEVVRVYGKYPDAMTAEDHERFRRLALERRAEDPLYFGVVVPLERSAVLAFDVDDVGFVSRAQLRFLEPSTALGFIRQFGSVKAVNQLVKSGISLIVLAAHVLLVLFLGYHLLRATTASGFAWVVTFWLASYAIGSAFFVIPEARRNITLLPVLAFMLFYAGRRGRASLAA